MPCTVNLLGALTGYPATQKTGSAGIPQSMLPHFSVHRPVLNALPQNNTVSQLVHRHGAFQAEGVCAMACILPLPANPAPTDEPEQAAGCSQQ